MELLATVGTATTEMPSISPNGATSAIPVEVTLATATPGASIYYTLDGSTPTTGSNFYSVPFTLPASATVKARAFTSGLGDSIVNTAVFAIDVSTGGDLNNYWTLNEIAPGSYANDGGGTAGACTSCPTPIGAIDDDEWHHVVAVYDGFFNENRLYIDGNLEASGPAVYTAGFDGAADVTIGELQNGLGNTFLHGIVDEIAFHDRAIPMSIINRH